MTIAEFLQMVSGVGGAASPIFAYLWWSERDERRSAQKDRNDVADKSTAALAEIRATLATFSDVIRQRGAP